MCCCYKYESPHRQIPSPMTTHACMVWWWGIELTLHSSQSTMVSSFVRFAAYASFHWCQILSSSSMYLFWTSSICALVGFGFCTTLTGRPTVEYRGIGRRISDLNADDFLDSSACYSPTDTIGWRYGISPIDVQIPLPWNIGRVKPKIFWNHFWNSEESEQQRCHSAREPQYK